MKRRSVPFIIMKQKILHFYNHEAEKRPFYNQEAEKRPFYNQEAEKLTLCPPLSSAEYVQRMYSFYW